MKTCHRCLLDKPLTEYNKNAAKPDGYGSTCRSCMKVYRKAHYESNKESYIARITERREKVIEENVKNLYEYLLTHPCVDCGITDTRVLEFDHRDASKKSYSISDKLTRGVKWSTIEEEIKKCDVRCANCHRIRTQVQFGYRKASWPGILV